ncbi:PadR family transcriptional regulator [Carnobacterium divergens]|uniref:PadR family transcriptional regulator n=1 Tax=Carnobacterium divergens TaxID=2748 RepID=UPI00288D7201|nr:PadR family transcriptional regulator [Carnobacterium divergens]MDT2010703.1 PadR family transcriptional regulator [Carnobacterium divergens]
MKETKLLKGVLEGCVLSIIADREVYGYELVQILKSYGFTTIVAGTVYPLLQKLEKQQFIESKILPSHDGPDRKYFFLTKEGQLYLQEFDNQWNGLVKKVNHLLTSERMYPDE